MARVFVLAGDLMQPDVANSLMQLIAEGGGEGDEQDIQVTKHTLLLQQLLSLAVVLLLSAVLLLSLAVVALLL
jgi:hypothetical protein